MTISPPERFTFGDLVLRRVRVDDAAMIAGTVAENWERLVAWIRSMSSRWTTAEFQRDRLATVDRGWEDGLRYEYVAITQPTGVQLGSFWLDRRIGPEVLELGYWLTAAASGQGYATSAARVLTVAALELPGIQRVEIHCDPANLRSRLVPERLGYRLDRVETDEIRARAETGRSMVWVYPPARPGQPGTD
jgi:RimJ/RimL family protein N-acetyltransferase